MANNFFGVTCYTILFDENSLINQVTLTANNYQLDYGENAIKSKLLKMQQQHRQDSLLICHLRQMVDDVISPTKIQS